jgi:2-methylisocitrate lyase-like PEP mutase family enzyme
LTESSYEVRFPSEKSSKPSQIEKGKTFRELHQRQTAFIIPNPWDAGSARLLQHAGFEALATTSMGRAFSLGQRDGTLGLQKTLEYASTIATASSIPVSADLENCFGDSPVAVAETIRLAAKTGIVGGSVEDSTGHRDHPIYDLEPAVERVAAAVRTARSFPFDFILTARAENYLHGRRDLDDTISRLKAYERAGADVLYAPGLSTKEEIAAVVKSVKRPVNVVMGRTTGVQLSVSELSALGVKRVSVGSALCQTALGALAGAAREMKQRGTFKFAASAVDPKDMDPIFSD